VLIFRLSEYSSIQASMKDSGLRLSEKSVCVSFGANAFSGHPHHSRNAHHSRSLTIARSLTSLTTITHDHHSHPSHPSLTTITHIHDSHQSTDPVTHNIITHILNHQTHQTQVAMLSNRAISRCHQPQASSSHQSQSSNTSNPVFKHIKHNVLKHNIKHIKRIKHNVLKDIKHIKHKSSNTIKHIKHLRTYQKRQRLREKNRRDRYRAAAQVNLSKWHRETRQLEISTLIRAIVSPHC